MTVTMQSFTRSNLGAFVKSNLEARGDDEGVIWHARRDPPRLYELYPDDFAVKRSTSLHAIVEPLEGCGGKADVLYASEGSSSEPGLVREYETTTWVPPIAPLRTAAHAGIDGCGGDTEIVWLCKNSAFAGSFSKHDAYDFSQIGIRGEGVYSRVDAIGGNSNVCYTGQWESIAPIKVDHHISIDVEDLNCVIQDTIRAFTNNEATEGIGGSDVRVWANTTDWDDDTKKGKLYEVDPFDMRVIRGPVTTPGVDPRGTGGS